jgi:hypothetical protein
MKPGKIALLHPLENFECDESCLAFAKHRRFSRVEEAGLRNDYLTDSILQKP